MRKSNLLAAVLTLFLSVPASITWAQTISSQKGLTTALIPAQQGTVKVYLPDDIRQGETISGTVKAVPKGKNQKQVEKNSAFLQTLFLNIAGNIVPVSNGKFKINMPKGSLNKFSIDLADANGKKISSINTEFAKDNFNDLPIVTGCTIPSHGLSGEVITIPGQFDGNAENTKCNLANNPVPVIAESPRNCFVQLPQADASKQTMQLKEEGNSPQNGCSTQINLVKMEVSAGRLELTKGEKTQITVHITGLSELKDTAILTLNNITTGIVDILPSNNISIPLSDSGLISGEFTKTFQVQSIKTGGFSIEVNLDLPNNNPQLLSPEIDWHALKNNSGFPGSYGYRGDEPCSPEGATIKWRWKRTFPCEISESKILACGHTKASDEILEKIKELLEDTKLDKANDIAGKMAKAFSVAKAFSYSIHVVRKYCIYDIDYVCKGGKWQPVGGVYVTHGTEDLGWHSVKNLDTDCWLTFNSGADEQEFKEALELALIKACK